MNFQNLKRIKIFYIVKNQRGKVLQIFIKIKTSKSHSNYFMKFPKAMSFLQKNNPVKIHLKLFANTKKSL